MSQEATPSAHAVGCGSCCGIFNLDIGGAERQSLLRRRTETVGALIAESAGQKQDFFRLAADYRRRAEAGEQDLPRRDEEIYVCVFLGFLGDAGALGCLIHPEQTGVERSQNAGFYGQSICQTYDCRTKDAPHAARWAALCLDFVIRHPKSGFGLSRSEMYSLLMADSLGRHLLSCLTDLDAPAAADGLYEVLAHRFDPVRVKAELLGMTSLEVTQEDSPAPKEAARRLAAHWAASPEQVGFWEALILKYFVPGNPRKTL